MRKYVLVFGVILSFNAFASNNCGDDLNNNCWDCGKTEADNCTARLDGTKLTIEGDGLMRPYYVHNSEQGVYDIVPWPKTITEVEISGVKDVQQGAFYNFPNLEKVIIGDGLSMIHWYTFTGCASLSEVILSDSVSGIGSYAFGVNPKLKTLVLPESLFKNGTNGLHWEAPFADTHLEELYCPQNHFQECLIALQTSGIENNQILKLYRNINGKYYYDGKFYDSLNNIGTYNYIKKRIYTIEEANQVAGKTNSFKIKYR